MRVTIDCPVCQSGNAFEADTGTPSLACDDCGFPLLLSAESLAEPVERCAICGCNWFYRAGVFKKRQVCYLCEASYYPSAVPAELGPHSPHGDPLPGHAEETAAWRLRVEDWGSSGP